MLCIIPFRPVLVYSTDKVNGVRNELWKLLHQFKHQPVVQQRSPSANTCLLVHVTGYYLILDSLSNFPALDSVMVATRHVVSIESPVESDSWRASNAILDWL